MRHCCFLHLFCSVGIEKHQLVRRLSGMLPDQGSLAWQHNLNLSFYLAAWDILRPFLAANEELLRNTECLRYPLRMRVSGHLRTLIGP